MKRHALILTAFGLFILIAFLNLLGHDLYFYWTSSWFDRLVHVIGGLSVGMFGLWLWWESGMFGKNIPSKKEAFITALAFGLLVGAGWEIFEFAYGVTGAAGGETYLEDTFLDLVSDFVGAFLAGVIGARTYFYSTTDHE